MDSFRLRWRRSAAKELRQLPPQDVIRIVVAAEVMLVEPNQTDAPSSGVAIEFSAFGLVAIGFSMIFTIKHWSLKSSRSDTEETSTGIGSEQAAGPNRLTPVAQLTVRKQDLLSLVSEIG